MQNDNLIDQLRLPVIVAPMFLVSGPDLVIASSNAGLIGSFPGPNARTTEELEGWMEQINSSTSNPWAFNMITHKTYDRFGDELDLIKKLQQQVRAKQVSQNRFLFLIRLAVLYCNSDFSMLIMRNITIKNLIDFE